MTSAKELAVDIKAYFDQGRDPMHDRPSVLRLIEPHLQPKSKPPAPIEETEEPPPVLPRARRGGRE
jgi:hypothetical protein